MLRKLPISDMPIHESAQVRAQREVAVCRVELVGSGEQMLLSFHFLSRRVLSDLGLLVRGVSIVLVLVLDFCIPMQCRRRIENR